MKKVLLILIMALSVSAFAQNAFVPGYAKKIKGESLHYHAPQLDADTALVVRSESGKNSISWETAIVPEDHKGKFVDFKMMMAIDVNPEDPRSWDILFNGVKLFKISSPKDTLKKQITISGASGSEFEFSATGIDKYGDLIGHLNFRIPKKLVRKNQKNTFTVTGETAQSRTWLIFYQYKMVPGFSIQPENALRKGANGNERVVKLQTVYYKAGAKAEIRLGNYSNTQKLDFGFNRNFVTFNAENKDTTLPYSLHIDGKLFEKGKITLKPVQEITIYLVHHSHVDIGYTHVQKEVEELQWKYIERCINLAEKTQHLPKGEQFKWNIEVMWALDSYWKNADKVKKERLKNAIRKGWIELDAFYANELTALCTSEELSYLMASALEIANECGVELKSAMISDIPGWTWGIVPVLSQAGVQYLSLGTNTFHRIGYTIEQWGDKPFYWQSASGEEKVMVWVHGKGYSSFHTGLGAENVVNKLEEQILLSYMNELQDQRYPYEKVILRYNIGSDNGPPDAGLSEKVRDWNERYASPKLVISTTTEAFEKFEKDYGKNLPVVKGDFTAYWEDGAASSAKETAINRSAAHTLSQAQTLMAMNSVEANADVLMETWKNILLYNEHTWGSWNSISEPHAEFTKQQWAHKRNFALKASKDANQLYYSALQNRIDSNSNVFEVINTHSWAYRDVVHIPAAQAKHFNAVHNEKGRLLLTQRLSDGSLIFIPEEIPAFSSRKFTLVTTDSELKDRTATNASTIENDFCKITLNPESGRIEEIFLKDQKLNIGNKEALQALNQYVYIDGRHPDNQHGAREANISLVEFGELMIAVQVSFNDVKGCKGLSQTYKIYKGLKRIDIVNTVDKAEVYTPEGVHFVFPFSIPDGKVHYDLAYAYCEPEKDQIKGSNRNFITIENWVDVSNEDYGTTWISKDAPLIQMGDISNDPIATGYFKELTPSQTLISYVMNNYWETNYLAAQGEKVDFRYSLYLNSGFNPALAERRSLEAQQAFVVIPVKEKAKSLELKLALENSENLIIQSITPVAEGKYLVKVFNAGKAFESLNWSVAPKAMHYSDVNGTQKAPYNGKGLKPMQQLTLLVELETAE